MSLSIASQNRALDALFGSGTPASYHLGLLLTNPETEDLGIVITEPSAAEYARVEVVNNTTNFPAAVNASKGLVTPLEWATPLEAWGRVSYVGFFDAATGGNLEAWAKLTDSQNVITGRKPFTNSTSITIAYQEPV